MRFFFFDVFVLYKFVFKFELKRWVYLLDVLMRNMKFIMLFVVEEDDCEEFVFIKCLGGLVVGDNKGSLWIIKKVRVILLFDDKIKVIKFLNESLILLFENYFIRFVILLFNDWEIIESSLVINDVGDLKVNILIINCVFFEYRGYVFYERFLFSG